METCRATYQSGIRFLELFNKDRQHEYTLDVRRCYMGKAPAISTVALSFGEYVAETWIEAQLKDINDFSGNTMKMVPEQIEATARVIRSQFGYMKVTELMHFFQLFKGGKYGHFWGKGVDPLFITESLTQFAVDRITTIGKYEKELEEARRIEDEKKQKIKTDAFKKFLKERGLTQIEFVRITYVEGGPPLTMEEYDEIGWLLRMGYEKPVSAEIKKTINLISVIAGKQ